MQRKTILISVVVLGLGCASAEPEGQRYELTDAEVPMAVTMASVPALVAAPPGAAKGSRAPAIAVCVQESDNLPMTKVLLEVRLAYAAWFAQLEAGGDWRQLRFVMKRTCAEDTAGYVNQIIVAALGKGAGVDTDADHGRPQIDCRRGREPLCQHNRFDDIISQGAAVDTAAAPLSGALRAPGFNLLSPYINWLTLDEDLGVNRTLNRDAKSFLLSEYTRLLAQDEPSYADLLRYLSTMRINRVFSTGDTAFKTLEEAFKNSQAEIYESAYLAEKGLLAALLNHVGRQFVPGVAAADYRLFLNSQDQVAMRKVISRIRALQALAH